MLEIQEISQDNVHMLPLREQPYTVIGNMKLSYDGGWSYTEVLTEHPYSKLFPVEDESERYLNTPGHTAFLAFYNGEFAGDIRFAIGTDTGSSTISAWSRRFAVKVLELPSWTVPGIGPRHRG